MSVRRRRSYSPTSISPSKQNDDAQALVKFLSWPEVAHRISESFSTAITTATAKPESARNRMRTCGQRRRICATMREENSTNCRATLPDHAKIV
jgi:hypothetical protein